MYDEALFFIEENDGLVTAPLLFPPKRILSLQSATHELMFESGGDYVVDETVGRVVRPPGSRIPFTTQDELYPRGASDEFSFTSKRGDPHTHLMTAEDDLFHRRQAVITYRHKPDLWHGYAPRFAGSSLPRTWQQLIESKPVKIGVLGDSISEGYNASGFTGAPPFQPPYAQLVAAGLELAFGSTISLNNCAMAGSTSADGVWEAPRVGAEEPHLVFIAFGMNDVGYADASDFAANIVQIMATVRRHSSHTEFVLVSPMLPNPEWSYPVMERFPAYRAALANLRGPGVVLADLTSLWEGLLLRKRVHDLTGNGLNHPNDFGHRLYAQTIIGLFTPEMECDR
jgi:acyl-CoA thioesterase-1